MEGKGPGPQTGRKGEGWEMGREEDALSSMDTAKSNNTNWILRFLMTTVIGVYKIAPLCRSSGTQVPPFVTPSCAAMLCETP